MTLYRITKLAGCEIWRIEYKVEGAKDWSPVTKYVANTGGYSIRPCSGGGGYGGGGGAGCGDTQYFSYGGYVPEEYNSLSMAEHAVEAYRKKAIEAEARVHNMWMPVEDKS